jgi:hypothetical protein
MRARPGETFVTRGVAANAHGLQSTKRDWAMRATMWKKEQRSNRSNEKARVRCSQSPFKDAQQESDGGRPSMSSILSKQARASAESYTSS